MDVVIRKTKNGPYVIEGIVQLVDAEGRAYEVPDGFSLCRCGASKRAPFCDGSHSRTRFEENSTANFDE
jgi:CDGSH-type Zn-finger protein